MYLVSLLLVLFISLFILNNSFKIGKYLNIIDYPNKRKLNTKKAVKIGSIFFIFPALAILFEIYLNQNLLNIELISFIFILFSFFMIGFVDDSISLSATKKILLYFIIIFIFIKLNPKYEINSLNFYLFETKDIKNISIYFTCFCIISLIVALDLMDGINLTTGIFLLSKLLLVYFIFEKTIFDKHLILLLIFPLILFLFFNAIGKVYLGTGGTCILALFISLIIIYKANNYPNLLSATHILALLLIPGLDMIRVFLIRFFKNGKIFTPDKRHLHHLMENKFGVMRAISILSLIFISTDLTIIYFYDLVYYIILLEILIFFTILKVCSKSFK